jgi:hypothetical protein
MTTIPIERFDAVLERKQFKAPSEFLDVSVVGIVVSEYGEPKFVVIAGHDEAIWPEVVDYVLPSRSS